MNCEKCKQRKATLFFADEGGRRHALCAACGALLGKAVTPSAISQTDTAQVYLPAPTLTALSRSSAPISRAAKAKAGEICRGCGMTAEEMADEAVMLGLRLCDGIDEADFEERFGINFEERYGRRCAPFVRGALMERRDGRTRLTREGWMVSNTILAEILE